LADPLPIAVLISGGGTTLLNLIQRIQDGSLNVDIKLVISSSAKAGGLRYADEASIPTAVVRQKDYPAPEAFRDAVFDPCREAGAELVVMGGYLKLVLVPEDFQNRVINIHPALIPSFCGKGFYGTRVHQAVLDYGAKVSGCTIHFVDNQYDHGPIISQHTVPVLDDDTPESLAKRVFQQECEAYPQAIRLYAEGCLSVENRRVRCAERPEGERSDGSNR
jgi:phosphoribosylglycinamide formyltransferase-1